MSDMQTFDIQNGILMKYNGPGGEVVLPEGITEVGSAGVSNPFENCRETLTGVVLPEGVVKINTGAFRDCTALKHVSIPDSVREIRDTAFEACTSLTGVVLPEGLAKIGSCAFRGCTALQHISIPGSVREMGSGAFHGCTGLTSAVLEEGAAYLGEDAFQGCAQLQHVTLPQTLQAIGSWAFQGCAALEELTLPQGLKELGRGCFGGCVQLRRMEIPEGVTKLYWQLFQNCSSLTQVVIPEGVTELGGELFIGCTSLTKLAIPASVREIDGRAFWGCPKLKLSFLGAPQVKQSAAGDGQNFFVEHGVLMEQNGTLTALLQAPAGAYTVPDGITRIGPYAFARQSSLTEVHFPAGIQSIGEQAFCGCTGLTHIEIPETIEKIEYNVFGDCSALTSVQLPAGLKEIGFRSFEACTSLQKIDFPDGLKTIRRSAFEGCTQLREVVLPDSVEEIGEGAFARCESLERVVLPTGLTSLPNPDGISTFTTSPAFGATPALREVVIPGDELELDPTDFAGGLIRPDAVLLAPNLPLSRIPKTLRRQAVAGFARLCAQNKPIRDSVRAEYVKYIRGQRSHLYSVALAAPELLHWMLQEKIVPLKDIDALLERAAGNLEATAMLLDYQEKQFTPAQRQKKQEKEQQAQMDLLFSNVLDTELAKKLWRYEKTGTGGIRLLGYKGEEREILVPSAIGKEPVTAIGPYAFSPEAKPLSEGVRLHRAESITSVVLPDSVTEIGKGAFAGCAALRAITLPDCVTQIGENAFQNCSALTSFHLPSQVSQLPQGLFEGCGALEQVTVGEGSPFYASVDGVLFSADQKVLLFCPAGKKGAYTVPETVERITDSVGPAAAAESAFSGCAKLKSITLSAHVTQIPKAPFADCKALAAVKVDEQNPAFCVVDGVLFNRDKTVLLFCPPAKAGEYTVPETVREISAIAFCKCSKLTRIELPEGLERIGDSAFYGCRKLESISVPSGVRSLERSVFAYCQKMTDITLSDQIQEIDFAAFYGCSRKLTIHAPEGSYAQRYAQKREAELQNP